MAMDGQEDSSVSGRGGPDEDDCAPVGGHASSGGAGDWGAHSRSVPLARTWRAAYFFLPEEADADLPPEVEAPAFADGDDEPDEEAPAPASDFVSDFFEGRWPPVSAFVWG
jgi:hypothetical protein